MSLRGRAVVAAVVALLFGTVYLVMTRRPAGELVSSGSSAYDNFGTAVAVSGQTMAVGADGQGEVGAAYVFNKTAGGWRQAAELTGSFKRRLGTAFGVSVAVTGSTVVVGDDGADRAYVFSKVAGHWRQAAVLEVPGSAAGTFFGGSVAVSGGTVVVGRRYESYGVCGGAVYVFQDRAGVWRQTADLKSPNGTACDDFGTEVAISGTTVLAGADQARGTGRAYLFTRTPEGWRDVGALKGSDTVRGDGFGASVAISGGTALVGAPGHAGDRGRVYVFTQTGTGHGWLEAAELKGVGTEAEDQFGCSVGLSGREVVVGADEHRGGRAYLFTESTGRWREAGEVSGSTTIWSAAFRHAEALYDGSGPPDDAFGYAVSVSAGTVVVGAPGSGADAGRAYAFRVTGAKLAAG